ncbi:MAG: hypothetical protein RL038_954 [Actinomycetota bacterium]
MRVGVKALPLACCAVEISTATALYLPHAEPNFELVEYGLDADYDAVVLMVAGTVTKNAVPAISELWEQLPEPKFAVAYGVCASSGGPYWDSYAVVPGAEEFLPIAMHVPGCPPPAATLVPALRKLVSEAVSNGF